MNTDEHIHFIIKEIVSGMRQSATITAATLLSNGKYQLSVSRDVFKSKSIINITNNNGYSISGVLIHSVSIGKIEISENIEFDSQYVYTAANETPEFMHEKWVKANERLAAKGTDNVEKFKKYPLILLLRNFKYKNRPASMTANLKVLFLTSTEQTYDSDTRFTEVITPILEPLLERFLQGIAESDKIDIYDKDQIEYDREDLCLVDGNPLPDYLDGILIELINVPFLKNC